MRILATTTKKPPPSWEGRSHHRAGPQGTANFVCVDGESDTTLKTFPYVLLGVGSDQIENPNGIPWLEAFEFLYSHYDPRTAFVGFYLNFDFTQWFKTLPRDKGWELLTREGQAIRRRNVKGRNVAPFPVTHGGWQFDLLASKRLRIRPKLCDCIKTFCPCDKAPWMYICDGGGFFQTSFLNVIDPSKWPEPIVTDEEYRILKEGKGSRAHAKLGPEMRAYNALENEVLARVLKVLDQGLRKIDVYLPPSKWFGPGQAAQAWMTDVAPSREEVEAAVPDYYRQAARYSYFGGWFELMMHGILPGPTWEYDINSAYPYVIASLPCLLHGSYSKGWGEPPKLDAPYTLVRADLRGSNDYIGTMLHRDPKGRICRPHETGGWYWLHELEAARRAGLIDEITWHEWMDYEPCACPPPLSRVADLYEMRLSVGKDTPIGKACKLVYNSEYGKFAQSIGKPMFGNPIYASLITAGCRTQILNAIATHPEGASAVSMVATDAIYFRAPHPGLPISNKLGEWDTTIKNDLTQFKPGVYWDDKTRQRIQNGETPSFKSRGVNARDLAKKIPAIDAKFRSWWRMANGPKMCEYHPLFERWRPTKSWPRVEFTPAFQMTTALQALMQGDWSLAGTKFSRPVKQDSNPWTKRRHLTREKGIYRSRPRPDGKTSIYDPIVSEPYDKRFGQEDPDNPFTEETRQAYGVSPDGYSASEVFDALMEK